MSILDEVSGPASKIRAYRSVPRTPDDIPQPGELKVRSKEVVAVFYAHNLPSPTSDNRFYLVYAGVEDVVVYEFPGILPVSLVRRTGTSAPMGNYLVDVSLSWVLVPLASTLFPTANRSCRSQRVAQSDPGDVTIISPITLLRVVPLDSIGWTRTERSDQNAEDSSGDRVGSVDE